MDTTTMKGTVQGYFDRAFDEMTDKELEKPLANSGLGVKAKLAPNSVKKHLTTKTRRAPSLTKNYNFVFLVVLCVFVSSC